MTKRLCDYWTEVNHSAPPTIAQDKARVYSLVQTRMKHRCRDCEVETETLGADNVQELLRWLRVEHGFQCVVQVKSRKFHPRTKMPYDVECIVITW